MAFPDPTFTVKHARDLHTITENAIYRMIHEGGDLAFYQHAIGMLYSAQFVGYEGVKITEANRLYRRGQAVLDISLPDHAPRRTSISNHLRGIRWLDKWQQWSQMNNPSESGYSIPTARQFGQPTLYSAE
jgi:hypothetical protein